MIMIGNNPITYKNIKRHKFFWNWKIVSIELLLVYLNPCCKFRSSFSYIMFEHLKKYELESFNKWNIGNIYLIITSIYKSYGRI